MWNPDDPQCNEADKVIWECIPYVRGKVVLDLGCGPRKALPYFVGVDNQKDTELFGIKMRPDLVVDDCRHISRSVEKNSVDAVFSSHLLEHIDDYRGALKDWWSVIKNEGHMVLYLPHRDLYPNIGQTGANPDHKHDFVPEDIIAAMKSVKGGWTLMENQVRNGGKEYSFLLVFRKEKAKGFRINKKQKHAKTACVVRYGGFGDMIQAASILPGLKSSGHHVTVMTTPRGREMLEHDPHVDEFYVQDSEQVPNQMLYEFWEYMKNKYDRFINLSESVEGSLLALPGRANHLWPHDVRHKYLNWNYLEFTAELAGLKGVSPSYFYPTRKEVEDVGKFVSKDRKNVVFALSGSSVHKFYPGQDMVIDALLKINPDIHIFLVGDEACKILEAGYEDNKRVTCLSGEIGIRETLALAQMADIVIGCETGVLNAVAFEKNVRKVCLLSHSSKENLTKHWVNSVALEPMGVDCYPCHRLHYDRRFCPQDKDTGASVCQQAIHPSDVIDAAIRSVA